MKPVLTTIAAHGARGHLLPDLHRRGRLHRRPGPRGPGLENVVLIGSDGLFSVDFVEGGGPGAEGMYLSSPDFSAFQAGYAGFLDEVRGQGTARTRSRPSTPTPTTRRTSCSPRSRRSPWRTTTARCTSPARRLRDAIYRDQGLPGHHRHAVAAAQSGDCGAPLIAVYQITARETDGDWPPAKPIWP